MSNDKFEFADLSPETVKKLQKTEEELNKNPDSDVILLAYKKR